MPNTVGEPSPEAVKEVVVATGCKPLRAKTYLKRNDNDVAKAIKLYREHHATTKPTRSSSQSTQSTVSSAAPEVFNKLARVYPNNYSEEDFPRGSSSTPLLSPVSSSISPHSEHESVNDSGIESEWEREPEPPEPPEPPKTPEPPDSSKWNFRLPRIPPPPSFQPGGLDGSAGFSIRDLVGAVQHGTPYEQILAYLGHHSHPSANSIKAHINDPVEGFPAMFYAAATNNEWIIRLFFKYGGNVNAVYGSPPLPLLVFAIANSKTIEYETTTSVATLLSLGADASVVPKAFYSPFCQDLPERGPSDEDLGNLDDLKIQWCKSLDTRAMVAETLNLTQRYHLEKSSKLEKPTERQRQVAIRNHSEDLFCIPYFLIGQSAATELLMKELLHGMLRHRRDPLVLVFAGPSGHGKTELARRLGALLSLELHVSDCTIVSRENELFGPRKPYVGAEAGSPLNNFLARKNGQKCISFLDEFERASPEIWNSLLIPFDKGEYQDRRDLRTIDCSRTIWILATNALDEYIEEYCKKNEEIFNEEDATTRETHLETLTEIMKEEFKNRFKPPLTGRISSFIPFLPFSLSETCVGTHKYLLELASEVHRPVNTSFGDREQLLGNIRLKIRLDASVCRTLAKGYDPQLGIRSLRKVVRDTVATKLDYEYMLTHDLIKEGVEMEDYVVFVTNGKIKILRVPSKKDAAAPAAGN